LSSADKGEVGSSDADVRTFCYKNFGFPKLWRVHTEKEGGERSNII